MGVIYKFLRDVCNFVYEGRLHTVSLRTSLIAQKAADK